MGRRAAIGFACGAAAVVAAGVFVLVRGADDGVAPDAADVETTAVPTAPALVGARRPAPASMRPAPTDAPAAATGSVRLRVVRAPDGAPVPGIPVFLRRDAPVRGPFHLLVWTDERGIAVFPEVEPGPDHRLRVQAGAGPAVDQDGIAVAAGVTTDLGDVHLAALGLVDALVLDPAGAPVEDAHVVATIDPTTLEGLDDDPFPLAADPPVPVATGRSDNHGRVRLEGVPPGLVAVRATKSPLRGATDRVRVPATGPDSAVVTIVLRAAAGIEVVVADEGRPVEGAPLRLGQERLDGFETRARGATDRDGRAVVGGFAAYVRADGELDVGGRGTFLLRGLRVGGSHRLELPPVRLVVVEVVDEDGAAVAGARVGTRSAATCAVDVRPLPREARRSRRRPRAPWAAVPVDAVGVTDAQGRVTLDVGAGAPRDVWALHPSYLAYGDPPALRRDDGPRRPRGASAGPTGQVRIVLQRGLALSGAVIDVDRAPVRGAVVQAEDADGRVSAHAVTDEEGRYVLAPVRPERTPWLTARLADPPLVGTRRIDVRVTERGHDVVVARPAWMRGTVLDVDGAPVEGAVVEIPSAKLSAMTDARGAYVLGPLPDPRDDRGRVLDVVARRVGLGEQRRSASRPAKLGEDVDGPVFRLGSGKDLEGYVQDTERRAVPFPIVEIEGLGGSTVRRVVAADEFGRFVVRDVPPGTYRVRGRSRGLDGYARDPVEVLPDAGAAPKVAPVILRAATTVTGYVVDDDEGDPVPGARVMLTSRAPTGTMLPVAPLRDETVADARGWFQLTTAGAPEFLEVRATHPSDRGRELTARERVDGRDPTDLRIEVR